MYREYISSTGGVYMKSRHIVRLFFSTLVIGGISTICISFFTRWDEYVGLVQNGEMIQSLSLLIWFCCIGFMFSLVSQMGFFAYLSVHRLGLSFFRSKGLWNIVQVVLIFVAIGDFLYFQSFGQPIVYQVIIIVGLLIVSSIIAFLKVIQTNKTAFIPSMFFMVVVTLIEWIPAIQAEDNESWLYFMLIPLLVCNGYQLFMLHHLQKKSYSAPSNPV